MGEKQSVKILLVEDDEGHTILIRENLVAARVINEIYAVRDGLEALDFLHGRGQFSDPARAPKPGLILMDIKLPKLDGLSLLKQIKQEDSLKSIPVIMLTSTEDQREINASYELGANSYVVKPVRYEAFQEKIKSLGLFLDIVSLPE